jgi:acetyl-CoA acetyltransferase
MTDTSTGHAPLSRASRRLLQLSLVTPRPCPPCGGCICLTPVERRGLRRVTKIARQWRRQVRREARELARSRAERRNLGQVDR